VPLVDYLLLRDARRGTVAQYRRHCQLHRDPRERPTGRSLWF
jgi:hypothetical protein